MCKHKHRSLARLGVAASLLIMMLGSASCHSAWLCCLFLSGCHMAYTAEMRRSKDAYVALCNVPISLGQGDDVIARPIGLRQNGDSMVIDYVVEGPRRDADVVAIFIARPLDREEHPIFEIQRGDSPVRLKQVGTRRWYERSSPESDRLQIFMLAYLETSPFPRLGPYRCRMLNNPLAGQIIEKYLHRSPNLILDESWCDVEHRKIGRFTE